MGSLPRRPAGRFRSIPGGSRRLTADRSGSPVDRPSCRRHHCLVTAASPLPHLAAPRLASPRLATPHQASPRLAAPRLITPGLVTPLHASPCLVTPLHAASYLVSSLHASPRRASPPPRLVSPRLVTPRHGLLRRVRHRLVSPRLVAPHRVSPCHASLPPRHTSHSKITDCVTRGVTHLVLCNAVHTVYTRVARQSECVTRSA